MTGQELPPFELLLDDAQALALAQLVKRIGWSELRALAVSEGEAYTMRDAVHELSKALAAGATRRADIVFRRRWMGREPQASACSSTEKKARLMCTNKDTAAAPRKRTAAEIFAAQQARSDAAKARLAASAAPVPAVQAPGPAKPPEAQKLDFFLANFGDCAIKSDSAGMEAPMFSLSTKMDMSTWKWSSSDGKKNVTVEPGATGRATQHDKDILIYCISQIVAAANAGKPHSRLVRFTAYDFFKATKRGTSGDEYVRFKAALKRLSGTRVTTNIETNKTRETRGFGFIDGWGVVEKSEKNERMVAVEVELSRWLFNAIEACEVLTISPDYFALRKPLERRLYEIARKHVGKQKSWQIGLEALRDKCGSTVARLRRFRSELEQIIEADALPEFRAALLDDVVIFTPKID